MIALHVRVYKLSLVALLLCMLAACSSSPRGTSGDDKTVVDGREVHQLLNKALKAADDESYDKADKLFAEMMTLQPKSSSVLNWYAIYLRERWRFDEAESVYKRALSYSADDAMTHWNMALLYEIYLGRFDKAIEHYKAYQAATSEHDKRIDSWVADLERRQQARSSK